jgi:hypothetical protein
MLVVLLGGSLAASAATTHNDDSCDIGVAPAATLLLPYFEVDLSRPTGENTTVSITNVSSVEQIAHVTLWTDRSYPVFSFDIFLTGYDVQSINFYELLVHGKIASDGTGAAGSGRGDFSQSNRRLNAGECGAIANIPGDTVTRVQQALSKGTAPGCNAVGNNHFYRAVGFATIDVVSECNSKLTPLDPAYYGGTLLYDNVLIGDYQQIDSAQHLAQASTLVHIRAIPEGGTAVERAAFPQRYKTNFSRTFYGRFNSGTNKGADARQPLPSVFATRWINGGTGMFRTDLKIWREGTAPFNARCSDYANEREVADVVSFDDDENATAFDPFACGPISAPCWVIFALPSTGRYTLATADGYFPRLFQNASSGWLYLNLGGEGFDVAQAWIVTSLHAEGRYSADVDATPLGNGCSAGVPRAKRNSVGVTIGPLP